MDKATATARARCAGRALALLLHGVMERQNGGDLFLYHNLSGDQYPVGVSEELGVCDCAEYRVNLHLMGAVSAGKRVARNPGPVCKHILAARVLKGNLDVQGVCEGLPEPLKQEARWAYAAERRRLVP